MTLDIKTSKKEIAMDVSGFAVSFVLFSGVASLAPIADEHVYFPYTQTVVNGDAQKTFAHSAGNGDFALTYVVSGRHRATRQTPAVLCPTGQSLVEELPLITAYDTTFVSRVPTEAERNSFFAARAAEMNDTIYNTDHGRYRRIVLLTTLLLPYTSKGVREEDDLAGYNSAQVQDLKKKYPNAIVQTWVGERGDFAGVASYPGNGDASLAYEAMSYDAVAQGIASSLLGSTLGMLAQVEVEDFPQFPAWAHEYSTSLFYTASAEPSVCLPGCKRVDIWSSASIRVNGELAGKPGVAEDNLVLAQGFKTLGAQAQCVSLSSQ